MECSSEKRTEIELPSLKVQSSTVHQDTMSLQDIDLLHDDYTEGEPTTSHMQRALTEESADTGYVAHTMNQPSPTCSIQQANDNELYNQIMKDALLNAPTLTAPDIGFALGVDGFDFRNDDDKERSPKVLHRRSYMLATRGDSSRGNGFNHFFFQFLLKTKFLQFFYFIACIVCAQMIIIISIPR